MGNPRQPQDFLRSQKKPITRKVIIPTDEELAERYESVQEEEATLRLRVDAMPNNEALQRRYEDAVAELESLQTQLEESCLVFVFRSMGRKRYEELLTLHSATDEQKKRYKERGEESPSWNEDSFPPALIHASLSEPELSIDDVKSMWESDDWNGSELLALFLAATEVNQTRRVVDPFGSRKGRG